MPKPKGQVRPRVGPYPGAGKVLDVRPLKREELSGRRRVPTLTVANMIPFLRFRKPQSEYLGRVLRDKIKGRQKRTDMLNRLEVEAEGGKSEGQWETIVRTVSEGQWGGTGGDSGLFAEDWGVQNISKQSSWGYNANKERSRIYKMMVNDLKKNKTSGDKMLEIVDREGEMRLQEKRDKRLEKMHQKKSK